MVSRVGCVIPEAERWPDPGALVNLGQILGGAETTLPALVIDHGVEQRMSVEVGPEDPGK